MIRVMNRILLVEDNDMMRLFLSNYFSKHYDVFAFTNLDLAIEWLKNENVHLILVDFPHERNVAKLMKLSLTANKKIIPMLILTDNDKSEQRIQAFQWGAKDSLSKPFNPVELMMRVNSHIPALFGSGIFSSVA